MQKIDGFGRRLLGRCASRVITACACLCAVPFATVADTASGQTLKLTTYQSPPGFHERLDAMSDLFDFSEAEWHAPEDANFIVFFMGTPSSGHHLTGFGQATFRAMRISASETGAVLSSIVNVSSGPNGRVGVIFVIMSNAADIPKDLLYCGIANTLATQHSVISAGQAGELGGTISVGANC